MIIYIICLLTGVLSFTDRIDGAMVNMLASSSVCRGVESLSGQTETYKIGMCCFSTKHAALRSKNTD